MYLTLAIAALAAALTGASAVSAQQPVTAASAYDAFRPDPNNIPYILPAEIKWTGTEGKRQQYKVLGDVSKPGPYILLMKWWPGQYSKPHFHEQTRNITVISGTWWVSSSTKFDPDKTFPLPAGTLAIDEPNTVHWDGAKDGVVLLQISGEGPARSISVDENGKPVPRAPGVGQAPQAD